MASNGGPHGRMITSTVPKDWRNLQDEVATILEHCGFQVEVEKTVPTARGRVEIDVFAVEDVRGRRYTILCECKHWQRAIPQTIVHGFRTVIADFGANRGYIISMKGFQRGAVCASHSTNLDLVTWQEFQDQFCQTWLENYLSPTIRERLDPLVGFTEPLVQRWMCEIPDEEVEIVKGLRNKYNALGFLVLRFMHYSSRLWIGGFPRLPLRDGLKGEYLAKLHLPDELLDARGYREFLELVTALGEEGIKAFQEVRSRNGV